MLTLGACFYLAIHLAEATVVAIPFTVFLAVFLVGLVKHMHGIYFEELKAKEAAIAGQAAIEREKDTEIAAIKERLRFVEHPPEDPECGKVREQLAQLDSGTRKVVRFVSENGKVTDLQILRELERHGMNLNLPMARGFAVCTTLLVEDLPGTWVIQPRFEKSLKQVLAAPRLS